MTARPRTLALTDAILVALRDGPGTPDEIAERVGNVACACTTAGRPGETDEGHVCWCCLAPGGVEPGWRPCMRHDVYRLLVQLRDGGFVIRLPQGARPDQWSLVVCERDVQGLEDLWDLPARARS